MVNLTDKNRLKIHTLEKYTMTAFFKKKIVAYVKSHGISKSFFKNK